MKTFRRMLALLTILSVCKLVSAQSAGTTVYLRHHHHWGGDGGTLTKMLEAEDYSETNRHYCYKGYISANLTQGIAYNVLCNDVTYGPASAGNTATAVGGQTITYAEITEMHPHNLQQTDDIYRAFLFPRQPGHDDVTYLADMLNFDVWCDESGKPIKISANRLPQEGRKLYLMGIYETPFKLEPEVTNDPKFFLQETEPGSMIYRSIIDITREELDYRTFTLFAPRYYPRGYTDEMRGLMFDDQRLVGLQNGFETTLNDDDQWVSGMRPYCFATEEERNSGWKFPGGGFLGKYRLTVDLRHSYENSPGGITNRIMAQSIAQTVKVSDAKYATFAPKRNAWADAAHLEATDGVNPSDVRVYYVTDRNNETRKLTLADAQDVLGTDHAISKNEGLLVWSDQPTTVTFYFTFEEREPQVLLNNKLKGVQVKKETNPGGNVYLLNRKNGVVAFYRWGEAKLPAYRAYLELSADATNVPMFFNLEDMSTSVDHVGASANQKEEKVYNLAGQQLSRMQRGVNIVGGKKVLY